MLEFFFLLLGILVILFVGFGIYLLLNWLFGKWIIVLKEKATTKPVLKIIGYSFLIILFTTSVSLAIYTGYWHILDEIESYKGVVHNKFSMLAILQWIYYYAISILTSIILVVISLLFSIKKLKISFVPVLINILAVLLPLVRYTLPSYDTLMISKARKIVSSKEFIELKRTFEENEDVKLMSILKKKNFVILNDIVLNIEAKSCGPIPKLFGFIGMYYQNADSLKYNSFSDLLNTQNAEVDSSEFFDLYNKMQNADISEIRRMKDCDNLSEYLFHSSGMAGERGLVQISEECVHENSNDSIIVEEILNENFSYIHRNGWQPF